jgi:hypothetical protein
MTPPTVQFIPAAKGAVILEISGDVDAVTATLCADGSPTASPSVTGLTSIQIRTDYGVGFLFNTQTNRDNFVSAYSSGTWTVVLDGDTGTTSPGWSYNTGVVNTRAYILPSDFSSFPSNFPYTVGDLYTLTLG